MSQLVKDFNKVTTLRRITLKILILANTLTFTAIANFDGIISTIARHLIRNFTYIGQRTLLRGLRGYV